MAFRTFAAAALLAVVMPTVALAADQCQLVRAASVDMGVDSHGGVEVPIAIAGKPLTLLVDTGGYLSMLNESTVKSLDLKHDYMREGTWMTMFGGTRIDKVALGRDINFGGLKANEMTFAIMPDGNLPEEVDGTLAPDILTAYDTEFDFANNKFNLYLKDHCQGRVVYWTNTPYAVLPMTSPDNFHIVLDVKVDGKSFRATLDTGSTRSIMNMDAAQSIFGIKDNDPNLKPVADDGSGRAYSYPFQTLDLNGVIVKNPALLLIPHSVERMSQSDPEIILGMGVLRQLHLYIAYGEKDLYITPATAH